MTDTAALASPSGYPRLTPEQRELMVDMRMMTGGWPGYLFRLRQAHRPTFTKGMQRPLVYSGCSCGNGLCPIPYLLLHIEDVLDAYRQKCDDFAAETRRTAGL